MSKETIEQQARADAKTWLIEHGNKSLTEINGVVNSMNLFAEERESSVIAEFVKRVTERIKAKAYSREQMVEVHYYGNSAWMNRFNKGLQESLDVLNTVAKEMTNGSAGDVSCEDWAERAEHCSVCHRHESQCLC